MSVTENTPNKPFLRALKCAYKLHKAGLSEGNTIGFLLAAVSVPAGLLPSAGAPIEVILGAVYESAGPGLLTEEALTEMAAEVGFEPAV